MHLGLSYSTSRLEATESGPEPTELIIEIICIMSRMTNPDITLFFSAHRVLWLCGTLTNLYFYCNFMATAFENLSKHLKLAIRQLEELSTSKKPVADEDQLIDLADKRTGLVLEITEPGSPAS